MMTANGCLFLNKCRGKIKFWAHLSTVAVVSLVIILLAPFSSKADAAPDYEFKVGIEFPSQIPVVPAVKSALAEMGINYVNYYLRTFPDAADLPGSTVNREIISTVESLGIDFSLACCDMDPPKECVLEALEHNKNPSHRSRFRGIVFDEIEHARLLNYGCHTRLLPPLADMNGVTDLNDAYDRYFEAFSKKI